MSMSHDERTMQRYVDGELSESDAAAFAARLLREPGLRAEVAALEALTARMTPAAPPAAPSDFTANVLTAVRRLPERAQLEQAEVTASAVRLCVRVLVAAGLLLGLGLAWHAGLLDQGGADTLEAAPAVIEQELERLDQQILDSMEAPRGGR
jgi:anti-sigma factor RsiW